MTQRVFADSVRGHTNRFLPKLGKPAGRYSADTFAKVRTVSLTKSIKE